jgi:hypothetical protein
MTDNCNQDIVQQARRNVADRYFQGYTIRAILAGEWDRGRLVRDETERLLRNPPPADIPLGK